MNDRRGAALAISTVAVALIVVLATRPGGPSSLDLRANGDDTGLVIWPESLAEMVAGSTHIVVGRHQGSTDLGFDELVTPDLTPDYPLPGIGFNKVGASVVVDSVLKSDGTITATQVITYGFYAVSPVGSVAIATDRASSHPVVWDTDTEFILFLGTMDGSSVHYLPFGECGRLLTDQSEVTCSDGSRSILDFLSGKSRAELIADIEKELANPSPSSTPFPSYTPEPT